VNACSFAVDHEDLEHLLNHIDHLVKVGGIEHVGLGLDFADYLLQHLSPGERAGADPDGVKPVDGLPGDEDISRIAERLAGRGYSASDIDLVMGENFARVFKETLGVKIS